MSKRYKEYLIDILTKSFQIMLGIAILAPIIKQELNLRVFIPSLIVAFIMIIWAGAIAARLEED